MEMKIQKADHPLAVLIKVELENGNGNGSGFFVDKDLIATNIHVVASATSVSVELVDRNTESIVKKFDVVDVTAFDAKNDLVILRVDGEDSPLPLGNSNLVKTGDTVQAVGFPDRKYSVTKAPIHSIRDSDKWIRMKVKTCGGISGGPVLNSDHKVIGIAVRNAGFFSYVIPINTVKTLLNYSQILQSLTQWQKTRQIYAYSYMVQSQNNRISGCKSDALVDLNKASELYPEFSLIFYRRGSLKTNLGQSKMQNNNLIEAREHYKGAIDDYTEAIRLCPDYTEAYNDRADALYNLGNIAATLENVVESRNLYQDANIDVNNAIKLLPNFAVSYHTRGQIKYVLSDPYGAIQDYEKAREIEPDYEDVLPDLKLAQQAIRPEEREVNP